MPAAGRPAHSKLHAYVTGALPMWNASSHPHAPKCLSSILQVPFDSAVHLTDCHRPSRRSSPGTQRVSSCGADPATSVARGGPGSTELQPRSVLIPAYTATHPHTRALGVEGGPQRKSMVEVQAGAIHCRRSAHRRAVGLRSHSSPRPCGCGGRDRTKPGRRNAAPQPVM